MTVHRCTAYCCLSGKLWYLQHSCVGYTIVDHWDSDYILWGSSQFILDIFNINIITSLHITVFSHAIISISTICSLLRYLKKMLFSHEILIQLTQVSALLRLSNGYTCLICIKISCGNIHFSNTIKMIITLENKNYTALKKNGITWSTGGMPEYWYPLWNIYCPW